MFHFGANSSSPRVLRSCLLALVVSLASCGGGGDAGTDTGGGGDTSGSGGNGGGSSGAPRAIVGTRASASVDASSARPLSASGYPRIAITAARKTQLQLPGAAATYGPYKQLIDNKLARPADYVGEDIPVWQTALLQQFTGDSRYCAGAIADADAMVAKDSSYDTLSRDSYLRIAEDLQDILLTYDLCRDQMSGAQRQAWIAYANQGVDLAWYSNEVHWPFDDAHNNYWYAFLQATLLVGVVTDGDNPLAPAFRALFSKKVNEVLLPAWTAPAWTGPGGKEGSHYDKWHRSLWRTLAWWRDATGEDFFARFDASVSIPQQINFWLHEVTPGREFLFQWGDEAQDATGRLGNNGRELLLLMMNLAPTSPEAAHAKNLLALSPEFTARAARPLNFIYDHSHITAAPLTGKTDLYLHTPASGSGKTFIRNTWADTASGLSYSYRARKGPSGSHDHSEKPAFQWFANGEFVVVNPTYFSDSGVAGTSTNGGAQLANIVRLEGIDGDEESSVAPTVLSERVVAAAGGVPAYYYHSFDARVVWPSASVYRRDYLHFSPNVLIVYDHIAAPQAKVWQINTIASPAINGLTATVTTAKNQLRVIDALPSGSASTAVRSWQASGGYGTSFSGGFRLGYTDPTADFYSVKVLDIGTAVSAAACSRATAIVTCDLTLNGQARKVVFGADGTAAVVN